MGLKPKFTKLDISKFVGERLVNMEQVIVDRLKNVGMQFVIDARTKVSSDEYRSALGSMSHARGIKRAQLESDSPSFRDQTGALRSSIGFLLLKDGVVIDQNFEPSGNGSEQSKGINEGLAFAQKVGGIDKGFSLVVVAGMDYAVYVEGYGYDVITGSSLKAEENMKDAIAFLEKQTKR